MSQLESTALPPGYESFIRGSAWYDFSDATTICVTGVDRAKFLQSFCTNDVQRLNVGEGCEAFFTDVKGKVLAHVVVLVGADEILLVASAGDAERHIAHLDRYIIREDVALENASDRLRWLLVNRAAANALLGDASLEQQAAWVHKRPNLDGAATRFVHTGLIWVDSWLMGTEESASDIVRARLAESASIELSPTAWHALRIESGWPMYGVDFNDENLPQEIARDHQAISLAKGCYLGQETVARIDALGHVNQTLSTVVFESGAAPSPGDLLSHGGAAEGKVTSVCWSPQLKAPLALAMLRRGHNEVGGKIHAAAGPGEVLSTPAVGSQSATS